MSKLFDLSGRLALITGSSRGIGRGIAEGYIEAGARVVINGRDAAAVAAAVKALGANAVAAPFDVTNRAVVEAAIGKIESDVGPIDILVNNAGLGSSASPRPAVEMELDYWDQTLELNLTVPMLLSKAVLPGMIERGWGRIIMVASIAGRVGTFHGAAYSASKHGVLGLMRSMAMEVCKQGVTVNAVCPGPVKTLMNDLRIQYDAQRLGRDLSEYEQALTPVGGRLLPDDVAPLAVYLAGDQARMVTGQAFNVCGGLVMS
jgi:NAD(P)-dependent dehydrogenase (short-subunit alcohol dehydrogenase family)